MNPTPLSLPHLEHQTRRHFLRSTGQFSLGAIALKALLGQETKASPVINPLAARQPQFAPKAKRVIYLHMSGGPPNLTFSTTNPSW